MNKTKIVGVVVLVALAIVASAIYKNGDTSADNVADASARAADSAPTDQAAVTRGAYIATAADCAACHNAPGSSSTFAGGYKIETPFGVIVSSNITPDRDTGIGNWTERDFFKAVRHGQSPGGLLYAAMPYNDYVGISDQDMHDLWAYMRTVKPVNQHVDSDQLPFPFSLRMVNIGWNLLFFRNEPFKADAAQTAEWNRGAYLVGALEHCAACHTPKDLLGGDKLGSYLQGGDLQGWYAPEIAGNPYIGLGKWSEAEIVAYLRDGSNHMSVASGPMAEAVENSTQHLRAEDLQAIAGYLKSVPGSSAAAPAAIASTDARMVHGAQLYDVNCSACHDRGGQGVGGMVTGFAGNPGVQSPALGSLLTTVLAGGRGAPTGANPTAAGMPAFAWKLSDADIADVLTYARNSWGNAASAVKAEEVAAARKQLQAPAALAQY